MRKPADWEKLVAAVADLIRDLAPRRTRASTRSASTARPRRPRLVLAIKADAARLLFNISCRDLAWAVIDSGIDATHPAFRQRQGKKAALHAVPDGDKKPPNRTRVHATYDFTQIDLLLDPDSPTCPSTLVKRQAGKRRRGGGAADGELRTRLRGGRHHRLEAHRRLLRVPHDDGKYVPPGNDHGTHVAGILAGDWRKAGVRATQLEDDLIGVCPDLRLYDLRVLDDSGAATSSRSWPRCSSSATSTPPTTTPPSTAST